MTNVILNKIKGIFDAKKFSYHYREEVGRIGTTLSNGVLLFEVGEYLVEGQYVFKEKILSEQQTGVMEYLNYANILLKEGHFEIDSEGVVKCRMFTDIAETQDISTSRIAIMLLKLMQIEARFGKGLYKVAAGEMKPEEI